jgi:hypothetical protein
MIPMVRTNDGIVIVLDGMPVHVAESDGHFNDVYDAVKVDAPSYVIQDILDRVKNTVKNIQQLSEHLSFDGAQILYDGEVVHNYAADRILDFIANGDPVTSVVNLLERLHSNTDSQVIEHLYRFLEHGKCPITQDGHFLAYKYVNHEFKDCFTGTFDNSVGATPELPRNKVDSRRNVTCSFGLHVCSFDYLPNYAQGYHVVACEVDPADVVAVPSDYNDTKMRVCKYKVVGVVDDYFERHENILASQQYFQVGGEDGNESEDWGDEFTVHFRQYGESVSKEFMDEFSSYKEAHDFAQNDFINNPSVAAAAVKNDTTGEILYTWGLWTV